MKESDELSNQSNENVWICRAGKNREYETIYLEKEIIGFNYESDLEPSKTYDFKEIKRKMEKYYEGRQLSRNASIVNILTSRMKINDFILLPMKTGIKKYYFGIITSECIQDKNDQFNFKTLTRLLLV